MHILPSKTHHSLSECVGRLARLYLYATHMPQAWDPLKDPTPRYTVVFTSPCRSTLLKAGMLQTS